MEDTQQYKDFYLQTASDYVTKLHASFIALQQNSADLSAQNSQHIAWHSLKSQSDFMGYKITAIYCHVFELYFAAVLKNKKTVSATDLSAIATGISNFEQSLTNIQKTGTEKNLSQESQIAQQQLGNTL